MKKAILLILFFLFGCAPSYYVYKQYDEFEKCTINRMVASVSLKNSENDLDNSVSLYPEVIIDKSGQKTYSLLLVCVLPDWLFIGDEESLILLIDGNERIGLKGKGSRDNREVAALTMGRSSHVFVTEHARYIITPELLRKIAHAGYIKVKIVGKAKFLVREFHAQTILNYRKFIDENI
jgi:hypothetical protein